MDRLNLFALSVVRINRRDNGYVGNWFCVNICSSDPKIRTLTLFVLTRF